MANKRELKITFGERLQSPIFRLYVYASKNGARELLLHELANVLESLRKEFGYASNAELVSAADGARKRRRQSRIDPETN